MIGISSSLQFPFLNPQINTQLSNQQKVMVYNLNWPYFFERNMNRGPEPVDKIFTADWLLKDSMSINFALSETDVATVRQMCQMAITLESMQTNHHFQIRSVTEEIIFRVFCMMADCIYDPETNFYSRDSSIKMAAPHVLSWMFWAPQDRVRLYESAQVDNFKKYISNWAEMDPMVKMPKEDYDKFQEELRYVRSVRNVFDATIDYYIGKTHEEYLKTSKSKEEGHQAACVKVSEVKEGDVIFDDFTTQEGSGVDYSRQCSDGEKLEMPFEPIPKTSNGIPKPRPLKQFYGRSLG